MKRYIVKALVRFGIGVLAAVALSWGALASSALDPFAFLTVEECGGDSFFKPPETSPMKLRSISTSQNGEHAPMASIEVEITGPRSYGAVYCLADFRGGQWCVAYSPMMFPAYAAYVDPGATVSLRYPVPLDVLMGPGPFRLYADSLGHIDLPSLQGAAWEDGAVVLTE